MELIKKADFLALIHHKIEIDLSEEEHLELVDILVQLL